MRYIVFFLLVIHQSVFAMDEVQTRYGQLKLRKIGEFGKGIFLSSKILLQIDSGYLNIEKVFQIENYDVALIRESSGGSGTIDGFFFITLARESSPIVSEGFSHGQGGEIKPVQKGKKIVVDLGYDEGVHKILTYQNGNISIQKSLPKKEQTSEDTCGYLYNDIYVAYVHAQECSQAPEEVSGMATVRGYYSLSQDPRLNLKAFQKLSRVSCQKGNWITYSEFKEKICGG